MKNSGNARTLVPLCFFALLSLVLLALVPLRLATNALGQSAVESVSTTSSVSSDSVSQQMNALGGLTSSFASRIATLGSSPWSADPTSAVAQSLGELKRANPSIFSAFLLDANGHLVAAETWGKSSPGADLSFRGYYRYAVGSDHPYISETFIGSGESKRKYVAVSSAVRNGAGEVTGVLVISVDATAVFQNYVDQFASTRNVVLNIYDQNGTVVAGPGETATLHSANDQHVTRAAAGNSWSGKEILDGKKVLISYVPVQGTGWVVSASVNNSFAFASIYKQRSAVVAIAAVLGLLMLVGLIALSRSFQARDRAVSNLRGNEKRIQTIIDTASEAYFEINAGGYVTEWNKHSEQLFNLSREDALGKRLVNVIIAPPRRIEALDKMENLLNDVNEEAPCIYLETIAISTSRSDPFAVEISLWRTSVGGEKRLSAFLRDISDRKRLEEERDLVMQRQRRLMEDLRQADKAKSDFISTVSHELRTPLTSIVGYLELVRDGIGGGLTEQQTSMLDIVDRNSRRLLGLIDDVLTLSRVESGVAKSSNISVDVSSLLISAQQAFVPSIMERNLNFKIDIATDVGNVQGDLYQLERVINNVLSNAVKFTPDGGTVSLSASRQGGVVRLAITDTGIGIPEEEQHRLFGRFFRASSAQEGAIQGTGLGLAIVKSIVERHGGLVSIQSELGSGTTVTVELPAVVHAPLLPIVV